jgi:hypothetical protein
VIYLTGCDHNAAQTYLEESGPDNTQKRFRELLVKTIEKYKPELIAEEHHPEMLECQKRRSIALEVASELSILHRFCEPSRQKKNELGVGRAMTIPDTIYFESPEHRNFECHRHIVAHRWPIREEYWISQLGEDLHKKVVFICGAYHRWTFRKRLESRGIEVRIIEKSFGASKVPIYQFAAYKDVRRNDFPPAEECVCTKPQTGYPPNSA